MEYQTIQVIRAFIRSLRQLAALLEKALKGEKV